jgi:hypothetical protein
MVRRMGIMTRQTLTLTYWLMHFALPVVGVRIGMTGITEFLHLLLEHAAMLGHVGAVAGEAIARGDRLMFYTLLKSGALMTLETVDGGQGRLCASQKNEQCRSQGQHRFHKSKQWHHFAFPS